MPLRPCRKPLRGDRPIFIRQSVSERADLVTFDGLWTALDIPDKAEISNFRSKHVPEEQPDATNISVPIDPDPGYVGKHLTYPASVLKAEMSSGQKQSKLLHCYLPTGLESWYNKETQ
jgi:hypothetical protein